MPKVSRAQRILDRMKGGDVVDLRSDTVTVPSPAMRRAIAEAEVGDDALGDDPTTRLLEETVADLLAKERALFFPSGVMANQTAMALLGGWGGEVLLEADAHILHYEEGAASALSGVQLRSIQTSDGMLTAELVRAALRGGSPFEVRTRALAIENTHLASGGRIMSVVETAAIRSVAEAGGLSVHLDGARLWHAAEETGEELRAWTMSVDTVMVALSKGLGCPVGSLLAGPRDAMDEAWRLRRRFGGGMRQSGILAAAGLYALRHHREGLREDHRRARELAAAFDELAGVTADRPETNIVLARSEEGGPSPDAIVSFLERHGILMMTFGTRFVRAVTHRDVDDQAIGRATAAIQACGEAK